ncbi:hypothetical protein [Enhygromyxa salina]|uniref:Uncharacterized protein n=1 Tax=Enhygromyxa salina TaxID=215803 RepID=A0A2S9YR50_9BACT|nr:hypothetical protein [Enhygromyxa salina]PRQ07575.1 hypothetical protein ENSA7_25650 [Enhygromyxa salina]
MERHPRRTEDLVIPAALAQLLGSVRAACGVATPAELDVDRVRDVEAAMGTRLPEPILALLAADLEFLRDGLRMDLGEINGHSAQARESRARGDLVVFGAEPGGHVFHGFLIGAPDDRVAVFNTHGRSLQSFDVTTWLSDRVDQAGVEPAEAPPLQARLVRAAPKLPEGRRARHHKWGVGRVMTEEGTGPTRKVKIVFPEVGVKAVVARFLEFLDDVD